MDHIRSKAFQVSSNIANEAEIASQVNWQYSEDPYSDSAKGIILAQEAFIRRDERFIERDSKSSKSIINKARAMYQYASNLNFDRNKSGEESIYENFPMEQDKYIDYDCESENSEDNQVQVDFPCCDDIMAIIDTDKQDGKIYFIAKIKIPKNEDFSIALQRVKGGGHDVEVIQLVDKKDCYYLYKISMTSQIKTFKILLLRNGKKVLESKIYSFSVDRIEYDAGISWDFVQNKNLSMSNFEGLLAYSTFNVIDQIDFFEKSMQKFGEKSKSYLDSRIEIDQTFEKFILNQKNPIKLLLQFQIILKSPQNEGQKMNFFQKPLIQKISNYFMKFMISFDLKIDESKKITAHKAHQLIECFLEIISIEMINQMKLKLIQETDRKQAQKKVSSYLEFLIQQKKFEIVAKYIDTQIINKFNFIHLTKGIGTFLDLIQQNVEAFDQTYVDLTILFISYYLKFTKLTLTQLISVLNKAYSDKKFIWNSEDQNERFSMEKQNKMNLDIKDIIAGYASEIAELISFPQKNYQLFYSLYKTVLSNKHHEYLKYLFKNQKLLKTIDDYIETMVKEISEITDLPSLEKGLKILINICLSEQEKHFSRCPNKITILAGKLLKQFSNYSKKITIRQKCQSIHNIILTSLMKNGSNSTTETIKYVLEDLAGVIQNKFDFRQITEIINECFDLSILSNLGIQEIYTNNFLKKCYEVYFIAENASDIQKVKGDFVNWHNSFTYKPYINAFLVESVAKLLTGNQKQIRKKRQIIQDLQQLIDRGNCPPYEKQTLKTIVQLDNFELDENRLLDVLTKNRGKLFILKKILIEGQQQKFILENLLLQFKRKAKYEQLPAKYYFQIYSATRLERNLIQTIFAPQKLMEIIDENVHKCSESFEKLTKCRKFIDYLNKKYTITDYQDVFKKLKEAEQETREQKLQHLHEVQTYINKIDENILRCYSFSSFFFGQSTKNMTLFQAIQNCYILQKRMIQNRDKVIDEYQNNRLTYGSIHFFKQELQREKQLMDLFMIQSSDEERNAEKRADPRMINELLKIFSLIKKIPTISNHIKGLLYYLLEMDQSGKFKDLGLALKNFLNYLKQISNQVPTTNISQLYHQYQKANKLINTFRFSKSSPQCLNFQDQKSIDLLTFFYRMSLIRQQDLQSLVSIKPQLNNMKQKCDEEQQDFSVDFEDLEKAEIMIAYIRKIYHAQKTDIRTLISSTVRLIAEHPRLKTAYQVFKKLDKLLYEFKNVHKGDSKMVEKVQQILLECIIDLQFDEKNNLSIKLLRADCPIDQKNKSKNIFISDDDIKKFKSQGILYITQTNSKKKTQQQARKVKNYHQFFDLLSCIDQIKQIWTQLLEWGYIIFRTLQHGDVQASLLTGKLQLSQSEQDQQFRIVKNQRSQLTKYIKERKDICKQWIKEVKQLYSISPKATLLQGQSIKNIYQILTSFSVQKIPNFLNICDPQKLLQYANTKKYKFVKNPRIAIHMIKDFFQFLTQKNLEVKPSVMDYSQSYIKRKLLKEQENDFIKGIIQLDPQRIKNMDMTKILICTDGTTHLDIKNFIDTALRDQKNQYVIIRPQKLQNKDQQYIIKQIKDHTNQQNKKLTLKLCLVSNTSTQALYQYLVNNLPQGDKFISTNQRQRQQEYAQLLRIKTKNVKIVRSACPGYGKTSWIIENSTRSQDPTDKKQRACFFLPISGAPQSSNIYERFQKITRQIYKIMTNEIDQNKKYSSLVIQIHNIDPNHYQIVNTFLQEIVTGRCVRYNGKLPKLIQNTKIYIEIQNIQSVNGYDPLTSFTFLKQINRIANEKGQNLVKNIEKRPQIDFSKFEKKKVDYILLHLDYFDRSLLDKDLKQQNLKRFDDPQQPKSVDEARGKLLMNKYFFDKMPTATFYQCQYFCRLLLDGCKAFSSSYGLTFDFLEKQYDSKYKKILGLATMRSKFFQVILNNCIDFLKREVEYEEFNYQGRAGTQQKLSSIPFLIIPNKDGESFSFIYKDHTQVPAPIRNFYISQTTDLVTEIGNGNEEVLKQLFQKHSISKLESTNSQKFDEKISEILMNISGNKGYSIQKDPNYSVNIDNFFKMCLITLRQRQNIPIVIMGEAGTGKTALLRHVSQKLYQSQFMTLNVNAGTRIDDLRAFLKKARDRYTEMKRQGSTKKIWMFFDEFNTLKQVGYIKEIMIDKKFEGQDVAFLQDVVIMAACNPFRKLQRNNENMAEVQNRAQQQGAINPQALAFHVLPPPHSMIECMWNYGALSPYQYKRYISKMISSVDYKKEQTTKLLLDIHSDLEKQFDSSFVSLRDIERFRTLYSFFEDSLPREPHQKTKTHVYASYNNYQERALILSFIFCYTLRIQSQPIKDRIYQSIESQLYLQAGHCRLVKEIQETDFFNRLKIDYPSIAPNSAIKENCYAFFVAIYNKLSMIIVGPPGCSKSLAIRILTENMKGMNAEDKYLKKFQTIRSITFQGSQLCTSNQVQALFKKAINPNKKLKNQQRDEDKGKDSSLVVVVFDEIGLADKSKDNPLKVIHPYLEVSKDLNFNEKGQKSRNYSFLGISNTILDLSKMSRMLVLRRPQPSTKELKDTAIGIGKSFEYGKNEKISMMIEKISEAFFAFVDEWHNSRRFRNFFSLRDFYSLIKYFLGACQQRKVNISDDRELSNVFEESVFRNLHGMNGSIQLFMKQYREKTGQIQDEESIEKKFDIIENILQSLEKESIRFPLVIVQDQESLSYLTNMLVNKFKKRTSYFERSPFSNDLNNNLHVLRTTAEIIKTLGKGDKLILNNIQPTIQTSLYDMLNKFYIVRGDQNYCKISEVQSGLTKNTFVNKDFNCICFLLQNNLQSIEAPFLSRFQKYIFSLKKLNNTHQVDRILQEIELFKKTIMQICKSKNLSHYKIQNFFQNCQRDTMRTLILRIFNQISTATPGAPQQSFIRESQQQSDKKSGDIDSLVLREVIYDMVMNSTQDFIMIYQYVLAKQPQIKIYSHSIQRALDKKKTFSIDTSNNSILFTTDKNVVFSGCNDPKAILSIKLQHVQKQQSFEQMIVNYLNSNEKYFFIQVKSQQLRHIQYLIAQIQKVKEQQSIPRGKSFDNKKIFILYQLDRKGQTQSQQSQLQSSNCKGISFLCDYPQIFYQGKFEIGMIKYDRKDFFDKVLDLGHILDYVQNFFVIEIKCKDEQNNGELLASFKRLYQELTKDKHGLFHAHIQEFIEKTEGTNVTISQSLILEILENPQFLKDCKNFKQALTKQLSNKSFYGVVAFFVKYLFENQALLSYSRSQIHKFNAIQHYTLLADRKNFIQKTKSSALYETNLKILMNKKIAHLKNEYINLKRVRRLPTTQRKFTAQLDRARLIHFSRAENQIILSKQPGSLSDLVQKISAKPGNIEKDIRIFKQQLENKSTFVLKNDGQAENSRQNIYTSMNKDQSMKELFIFEILIDFAEKKGLNVKHTEMYMKILKSLINFGSTNGKKTLDLEYLIYAILAYEQILTFIFKLFSVFWGNNVFIIFAEDFYENYRIKEVKDITQESIIRYVTNLIKNWLEPILTDKSTIAQFKGPKVFYEIFTNCMLQIQNIEKVLRKKQSFSSNLVSLRDMARFCAQFNEETKFENLENYIKIMHERKNEKNIYSVTFSFVESLNKKQLNEVEKQIIMKFQANKIFLQWFKDRPDDADCLKFFIDKCESDKNFCHNSMHVMNYLLNQKEYNYESVEDIERVMQNPGKELTLIAKYSKQNMFQNNLCILLVNIFLQKLQKANAGKSHKEILEENKKNFITYYKKLILNNLDLELFQIFLFVFIKFVLISYTELFAEESFDLEISELLNEDNYLSTNARLFCLKILRRRYTAKEIKSNFIDITRFQWSKKIESDFKENQERSLNVPRDFCSAELQAIFNEIIASDGSAFVKLEKILDHTKGFENRYSILNFFLRFYYTLSYNEKTYKEKTIEYFGTIHVKFQENMGKVESDLIERYLRSEVSPHFVVKNSQQVNEQDLIPLNLMNMFLASKNSISPLHSLFCKEGQLSPNIFDLTSNQFCISGPENPYVNTASGVIELTRNNNIGVYLCCSDCDYIYCHENCGWPNQTTDCPMCGQKIGCKPGIGNSHTISRDEKGARRLMSKVLVDGKSPYYVGNMKLLTEYWEVQRKYIQAEIDRMKMKKQTTVKINKQNKTLMFTGLNVQNSGRVSTFSYKLLQLFIDSICYLFTSMKVINNEEVQKLLGAKTPEIALNKFHVQMKRTIEQTKTSLNINNKFNGWMFGISRYFMMGMVDFKNKFTEHQRSIINEMEKLKQQMNQKIQEKKISQDHINLYVDLVKVIESGYFIKQQCSVNDYTASNRFTRDFAEKMFENLVKIYTGDTKFDFSVQNQILQGKMQFPFDSVLTQDQIDKEKYNYYRIFKIPDQQISHHQITVRYEAIIKEKYPYLDFILKNSEQFSQMKNFSTVITFINELHKQVNNKYERTKAEESIASFIQQLKEEQGNALSKKVKNYPDMIQSWKKLAKFLGMLRNGCKDIGTMNDGYNDDTPFKAFLLDQSTKENVYGLMIGAVFSNFAQNHNEAMAILNSRKNLIKAYSSLNLFNDILKIHPQFIEPENIFTLDDEELKQNLESCSVASIIYGQNFIFHNFDAYQEYFLKKLQGKCQIISDLNAFINVCYNGEAFSAQNEGSGVLAEIREILDRPLSLESIVKVKEFMKKSKQNDNFEKSIVQVRGDLEKIMLTLNGLRGNFSKDQSCSQIIKEIQIQISSNELKSQELSEISICEIYDLYQKLEDQLKHQVLKRLSEKYKVKMENEKFVNIENFLRGLPKVSNDQSPTIQELESAVMKFVSRTLQNGIFDAEKSLVQFVTSRGDFWPKDYDDSKKEMLTYDPSMLSVKIGNVMNFLEIIANVKKDY